jgi:predicted nucleic acid-binding Zn ribbon protein
MTGIAMSGDEQRRQRRKRNLLLFGVHLLLALAILGWFVWSVAAK